MVEHLFTLPNGMECKIVETKIAEHEIELRICKVNDEEIPPLVQTRYREELRQAILATLKLENNAEYP